MAAGETTPVAESAINATRIKMSAENVYNGTDEFVQTVVLVTAIVVPIIFTLIFVVGIIGNVLLVYTVLINRAMRTNPNVFLVSLAVGDFMLLLISVPFTATIYTVPYWIFGEAICKINESMQTLSLGVSIFTLTAVSGDRFIAVVFPLVSYKWSTMRRTLYICAALWMFSTVLAIPDLVGAFVGPMDRSETDRSLIICQLYPDDWPDWYRKFRPMFRFAVYFVCPLLVISVMYVMIAVRLNRTPVDPCNRGASSSVAWAKQMSVRKKVSKMVLCIVVVFAACWIPRYVYTIWYRFNEDYYNATVHFFKIFGFCMSFAYSCVNPVALYFVSDDFRQYFDHYLFGCCCKSRRLKQRRGTGYMVHSVASNGARLGGSHTMLSYTPGNTPNMSLEDIRKG